jgi:hypothetical protein
MEELFLVLHKVKGKPAIDVAQRCLLSCGRELWWVPTSGHRVWPLRWLPLDPALSRSAEAIEGEEWARLPDHYAHLAQRKSLVARLLARVRRPRLSVADALAQLLERSLRQSRRD